MSLLLFVGLCAILDLHLSSLRSLSGEMDETDAGRFKRYNDDSISLAPSIAESIIVEGNVQSKSSYVANAAFPSLPQTFESLSLCCLEGVFRKPERRVCVGRFAEPWFQTCLIKLECVGERQAKWILEVFYVLPRCHSFVFRMHS